MNSRVRFKNVICVFVENWWVFLILEQSAANKTGPVLGVYPAGAGGRRRQRGGTRGLVGHVYNFNNVPNNTQRLHISNLLFWTFPNIHFSKVPYNKLDLNRMFICKPRTELKLYKNKQIRDTFCLGTFYAADDWYQYEFVIVDEHRQIT